MDHPVSTYIISVLIFARIPKNDIFYGIYIPVAWRMHYFGAIAPLKLLVDGWAHYHKIPSHLCD